MSLHIPWPAAWRARYSPLAFSAVSAVVWPPGPRGQREAAPSASVSPSVSAPTHTAAPASFWAADP